MTTVKVALVDTTGTIHPAFLQVNAEDGCTPALLWNLHRLQAQLPLRVFVDGKLATQLVIRPSGVEIRGRRRP